MSRHAQANNSRKITWGKMPEYVLFDKNISPVGMELNNLLDIRNNQEPSDQGIYHIANETIRAM